MDTQKYSQRFLTVAKALVQQKVKDQIMFSPNGSPQLEFLVDNKKFTAIRPVNLIPTMRQEQQHQTPPQTTRENFQGIVLICNQDNLDEIYGHVDLAKNTWLGYDTVEPLDIKDIEKAMGVAAGQ